VRYQQGRLAGAAEFSRHSMTHIGVYDGIAKLRQGVLDVTDLHGNIPPLLTPLVPRWSPAANLGHPGEPNATKHNRPLTRGFALANGLLSLSG
jgi:hypothetical protein